MKRTITAGLVLLLTTFWATYPAYGSFFGKKQNKAKDIKERLITLRNWELMEEFNLKGERAQRVFDILKRFDDEREFLIRKRRRLLGRLREGLRTGSLSDARIKKLLTEITNTNVELARIPQKELKGLEKVFSPRELARYMLFSQRFAQQARRLLLRPGQKNKKPM